jgi:uncharacterized delta-60 repeat protein
MSDREAKRRDRTPTRSGRDRRPRCRPGVEGLEGRQLLSYGGSPDLSFNNTGFAAFEPDGLAQFQATASVAQSDGKLVVAGVLNISNSGSLAVGRYNADGTLDTTFGTGGYFTSPTLTQDSTLNPNTDGLAIQSNGDIVMAGFVNSSLYAVRLNPNGTPDTTFGTGGISPLGPGVSGILGINLATVALLPDGKVAIGRQSVTSTSNFTPAVELLNSDGSIDTSFGTAGVANFPLPAGATGFSSNFFGGLVAQPDGKLVLDANVATGNIVNGVEIGSTRFNPDGTLDTSYGTGGQAIITPTSVSPAGAELFGSALAIQPDGKLVIGGSFIYAGSSQTGLPALVALRLNPDGTPDATFGIGGADVLTQGGAAQNIAVTGIALQPDGKILMSVENFPNIVRFNADGLPDTSFGTGGTAMFPGNHPNNYVGLSVLASGKIIAAEEGDAEIADNTLADGMIRLIPEGAPNDFNNDGVSDPAVLITDNSIFAAQFPGGNTGAGDIVQFGAPGAGNTLPAPGAYDGGGTDELAVYLTQLGVFAIRPNAGGPAELPDELIAFGTAGAGGSLPAEGDYAGNGTTQLAVYLPALGEFAWLPSNSPSTQAVFVPIGLPGAGQSIPAPGDYYGLGFDDFAVYEPSQNQFVVLNPVTHLMNYVSLGIAVAPNSIPAPGDYDGSGKTELAVYEPSLGQLVYQPASGAPLVTISLGTAAGTTAIPVPGDYDGSGKTEAAAYNPVTGTLVYVPAGGGAPVSEQFGSPATSIPYSLAAADTFQGSGSPNAVVSALAVPAEIPLTPDVLGTLDLTTPKKKASPG